MIKRKRNALNPRDQVRTRSEFIDYDYIHKLPKSAKKWLGDYTDEYYGGAIAKDGNGEVKENHLHNTSELAKDCYDRNNRQNNDVYGVTNVNILLTMGYHYGEEDEFNDERNFNPEIYEEAAIRLIDDDEQVILSEKEFLKLRDNLTPEMQEYYMKLYSIKD